MNRESSRSEHVIVVLLSATLLLVMLAGFNLAGALAAPATATNATPTLPPVLNQTATPTASPTPTATPTQSPTPSPTASSSDSGGDGSSSGQPLVVDDGSGGAGGGGSAACDNASYETIQAAVDDASRGSTVVVCPGMYTERVEVTRANLTLRADGDVVIENSGESAVWINAPQVTLRGFTIRTTEDAGYTIEVGGRNARIRDNTVNSTRVGIFLSDGNSPAQFECRDRDDHTCDPHPPIDTELGAATESRVVNNTVRAVNYSIWADADQTVVQDNTVPYHRTQDDANRLPGQEPDEPPLGIVSSGNETTIRDNRLRYDTEEYAHDDRPAIKLGLSPFEGHNSANQNRIEGNTISGAEGPCMKLAGEVANKTIIHDNHLTTCTSGIVAWSHGIVIRNNTINRTWDGTRDDDGDGDGIALASHSNHTTGYVISNTITGLKDGMEFGGPGEIIGNNIRNSSLHAIRTGYPLISPDKKLIIRDNVVTENEVGGIVVSQGGKGFEEPRNKEPRVEIHQNRILNNGDMGIWVINHNKADGKWLIVNATNNYWGCGGPSGSLRDPYTNRTANGTGDRVTASDEPGVTNVHFDPFLVYNPSSCPSMTSTPTPTASPSPSPTPSPTPPADGGGPGGDGGGGDGNGTGPGTGSGDGSGTGSGDGPSADSGGGDGGKNAETSGSDGSDGSDGDTSTPPPTPSATPTATPPPTPTPPDTPTPTPAVEPGFGVLTWLVGVAMLLGVLALRRRSHVDGENDRD